MLYYKNNRFHIGGLSYALPEDICIVTDYERSLSNGFAYKSLDQKILVTVDTYDNRTSSQFNLKEFENNDIKIGEISPFRYANIKGESAIYFSKNNEYYEIRLKLPRPTESEKILIILVEVKSKEIVIKDAITNPIVTELLLSLRKDLSAPVFLL